MESLSSWSTRTFEFVQPAGKFVRRIKYVSLSIFGLKISNLRTGPSCVVGGLCINSKVA